MKALKYVLLIVLVAVIGAVAYVVVNAGSIVKQVIETVGSDVLGVPVTVRSVDLSLDGGSIGGLQISNPEGFETPYALRVETAAVKINAQASTTKLVVIDQILVDQAEVNAEFVGRNGNLQTLQKNIEASVGPSEPETEASDVKVIIESFDFTNANTRLSSDVLGGGQISVPDLHLTGIGRKESGVTAAEAAKQLFGPVIGAIVKAAVAQQTGIDQDKIKGTISDKIGSGLKSLTGSKSDD
jgi:hypothetical protein